MQTGSGWIATDHGRRETMNALAAGALGGLLATAPMTVIMTRLFQKLQLSEQYPLPPREVAEVFASNTPGIANFGAGPI